jgi:uncharacterized protein (DUF2235 family)
MPKTIVFCADGTWNGLGEGDAGAAVEAGATNVLRLFAALDGRITDDSLRKRDEQEKVAFDADGEPAQVAKYLHGVGDSRNAIRKLLGGVFGEGFIERIVRGYTFVSRHYQPGDRIVLTGFSRGAYTVRALAGMITKMGLLPPREMLGADGQHDPELAYRLGTFIWTRYREQAGKHSTLLGYLAEFKGESIALDRLVAKVPVDTVAVWDTVGSLGIPVHDLRDAGRIDIFQFADCALSSQVAAGFHAVALDEERTDFMPTLWDARDGVVQRWFCGAHSDVGGGGEPAAVYSSISLQWMADKLRGRGVRFTPQPAPGGVVAYGPVGRPYERPPFDLRPHAPRPLPADVRFHPSVQACLDGFAPYQPESLRALLKNRRLDAALLAD